MDAKQTDDVSLDTKQTDDQPKNDQPDKEKTSCLSKFSPIFKLLFSTVGLFFMLMIYIAAGAYLFVALEGPSEEHEREVMITMEGRLNDSIDYLASYFTSMHYDKSQRKGNCSRFSPEGSHPSQYYKPYHEYAKACPQSAYYNPYCKCLRNTRDAYTTEVGDNLQKLAEQIVHLANNHRYKGDSSWDTQWTIPNSALFTMTTLTLIGYGNIAPATYNGRLMLMLYSIVGLPLMMLFLANIGTTMANNIKKCYSRLCCRWCRVRRRLQEGPEGSEPAKIKTDIVGAEDYQPTDNIAVPIAVALTMMLVYIGGGGAVFHVWEDWDLRSACYFCFITLTTIGFGDMAPVKSFTGDGGSFDFVQVLKMLFTTLYCLLGLAFISMTISLTQEQVMANLTWFSYAVGLKEDENANANKYIIKKSTGVKETPPDKTGNKLDALKDFFGKKKKKEKLVKIEDIEE